MPIPFFFYCSIFLFFKVHISNLAKFTSINTHAARMLCMHLPYKRMMALEEGSGAEDSDNNLIKAMQWDEIPLDSIR